MPAPSIAEGTVHKEDSKVNRVQTGFNMNYNPKDDEEHAHFKESEVADHEDGIRYRKTGWKASPMAPMSGIELKSSESDTDHHDDEPTDDSEQDRAALL